MFLRHRPCHLQPPYKKFFIAFPLFALKNCVYIVSCPLNSAGILFVFGWLVYFWCTNWFFHMLKVKNLFKLLVFIVFYNKNIQKIKVKSHPPTLFSKKVPKKLIFMA